MKSFTWVDLRHCQRQQIDEHQRPTAYGYVASVATAVLLNEQNLTPTHWLTSTQERAIQLGYLIGHTLELDLQADTVPSLSHLRADLGAEHYVRFIREVESAGTSSKIRALQTPWVRQRLFDRAKLVFHEVGDWVRTNTPSSSVLLVTSHGYAIAMRHLRMKQLVTGIRFSKQLAKSIDPEDIEGGMFAHCEGSIYHDVSVDRAGRITGCDHVEIFRLPPEVKALKKVLRHTASPPKTGKHMEQRLRFLRTREAEASE